MTCPRRHELPRLRLAVQAISIVTPGLQPGLHSKECDDDLSDSITLFDRRIEQAVASPLDVPKLKKSGPGEPTLVRIDTVQAAHRCPPVCPCQCHVRFKGQTPRWLQTVFGVVFWQFSGTPLLSRQPCNFTKCRSRMGSAKFEYLFPTAVLSGILRLTGTWSDLGGIGGSWSLRIPEYISSSHISIEALINRAESPQVVEKFLDTHKYSARAIIPTWQKSLLDVSLEIIPILFFLLYRTILTFSDGPWIWTGGHVQDAFETRGRSFLQDGDQNVRWTPAWLLRSWKKPPLTIA